MDEETIPSGGRLLPHGLDDEMKTSYINYAMSVIIGRALPDVRDGLKPVHRRVLYGMHEGGHTADKKFSKSARSLLDRFIRERSLILDVWLSRVVRSRVLSFTMNCIATSTARNPRTTIILSIEIFIHLSCESIAEVMPM